MPANLFDPLVAKEALEAARERKKEPGASEVAGLPLAPQRRRKAATAREYSEADIKADFRLFLILMWRHLGLPDPTPLQLSIAHYLQHGPQRSIIMAFRGAAKSWITYAYCLWCLYRDPQEKIMLVSASLAHAVKGTQFCLSVLREFPLIKHLAPKPDQRQSSQAFDVAGAKADPNPSFIAKGITGQVTGGRASKIVPDDIEVSTNSRTVTMRQTIRQNVTEFENILMPVKGAKIVYLGTPHDADSLYGALAAEHTYAINVWPALYPTPDTIGRYGDRLAPFILDGLRKDARMAGHSTEPARFSDAELQKRKDAEGTSAFTLQYLLDTSLSDRDKYPLKLRELMVLPLDTKRGPRVCTWGMGETKKHLPSMGFGGDYMHAPAWVSQETDPYNRIVASIDPSGRGQDESSLLIVAELHGMLYALANYASMDGYSRETLEAMASMCVQYGVHEAHIEDNFGDGMFTQLFRVVLTAAWKKANEAAKKRHTVGQEVKEGGTEIIEVKTGNNVRKEQRILSILEPITQQHRLVINEDLVVADYESLSKIDGEDTRHKYSLMWQYTHFTRDKGGIPHDDRLETLAGGCAPFAEAMGIDPAGMASRAREEELEQELEAWLEEGEEVMSPSTPNYRPPPSDRFRTKAAGPQRR